MKQINTYFFNYPNMGDSFNTILLPMLFNIKPKYAVPSKCELTCIGSNLDDFFYTSQQKKQKKNKVIIWGGGFNEKNTEQTKPFTNSLFEPIAVRGKITNNRIYKQLNIDTKNTILGDPGLLCPFIVPSKTQKIYDYCIIPHYVDYNNQIIKEIFNFFSNSIVIDVTKDCIENLNIIASSKYVISTSLHGLIFADAYNIPNAWIKVSDKICGGQYKYNDYYSIYNNKIKNEIDCTLCSDFFERIKLELNENIIETNTIKLTQEKLIASFLKLKEDKKW